MLLDSSMFRQIHIILIALRVLSKMLRVSGFSVCLVRVLIIHTGIVYIFKHLDSGFNPKRVCIKIPSSWEGLQACRILESSGITTLATTLFTIEQAALAGEMGCHYIAPYVNELKVHFDPGQAFLPRIR